MAKIEDRVSNLVQPLIEDKNIELVDVEYIKEGKDWFLRVFIDKPGGINLDDCELISSLLDPLLDEVDYIPNAYYLEVSSPGIERPLKTTAALQRFIGHMVGITTYQAFNQRKKHQGKLKSVTEENLVISIKAQEDLVIPRGAIAKAHLVWVDEGGRSVK